MRYTWWSRNSIDHPPLCVSVRRCAIAVPADPQPSLDRVAPPLVGRERERAILRDHLDAALAGQGSLVLISGEAGIGKTTLADALCREAAAQGALVLTGHCYDLTETPPYGLWVELFEDPPGSISPLPAPFAPRGALGTIASQATLFEQVRNFLGVAAISRPLVLLLEDLHWADPASLDLLRYQARHLAFAAILIVATYRAEETTSDHPLVALLPSLVREGKTERLNLRPLDDDDVRTLLAARYPLPDAARERLVAYLQTHTDGNPFFIREFLRLLAEESMLRPMEREWMLGDLTLVRVPSLVRQVITVRLTRLGEVTQRLLAIAAVIGPELSLSLWAIVAAVDEETLLAVTERAIGARILEETPDRSRVRFVHALIRETLYEGIPLSQRRIWHRQIGELLATRSLPDPDEVAYHFQCATDRRAFAWLVEAGGRARRRWAWLTAAERYEAALAIMGEMHTGSRAELLYFIALLRQFVDPANGVVLLEEVEHLAATAGDQVLAACARYMRGALRCYARDYRQGLADLETGAAALDALAPIDPVRLQALDVGGDDLGEHIRWGGVAAWLALLGRYAEVRALGSRLSASRERREPNASLDRALGIACAGLGEPSAAIVAYAQSRQVAGAHRYYYAVAIITLDELERVGLPYHADRVTGRRILAEFATDAWRQAPGVFQGADSSGLAHLLILFLEGVWIEAQRLALIVRTTQDLTSLRRVATRILGNIARHQGDADLAWTLVWEVLPAGPDASPGDFRFLDAQVMQQLAFSLAIDTADLEAARQWLDAHDRWLAWSGSVLGQAEGQLGWATYHRAVGNSNGAYESATRAFAHAASPRQPLALLAAHRLLGELDTDAARFTDAETHLDAALALAEACAAPYERALTLLAIAELCIATDGRHEAVDLLHEARAICESLGAKPALVRADALMTQVVSHVASVYPAHLTEREVEVLRLVAAGHTNRQIADMLSLSERTVHVHVRNIFTKTHTDNRAGATAFAFRHDLA